MSNIPAQFDMSSPEGVVAAPKGAKFFRDENNFFLSVNGQTKRLLINKKAFLMDYYNEPWFPTLSENIISFNKPYESWVKTGEGTNKNGWVFLGSVSSFVSIEDVVISTPSPTPSQTPAASVTPTPTPTPEATPTPTPDVTPTPTASPTTSVTPP